ncbi:hypothetical protein HELRODRAFT_105066 [Helobdella robusta]|uniref:NIF3-like protein 1 n=1 Tax=Helobdella robusta TaxID=6412 RepID=T1EDQ3_HELRO|nr:hypothetical protein HELRODRAFT_105066 [Helobdella robusta]ESO07077.1 hypothetical protein HELRODRAFT_105066 [Helobdella robusta]
MFLRDVIEVLEKFAPLSLAAQWDNVGLLVEPDNTSADFIKKIMLTNDLTLNVMKECIDKEINLIISYHPPIFKPVTRLLQSSWKESVIMSCVKYGIALYSPHTCWDVVENGVNDWLLTPFKGKKQCLKARERKVYRFTVELPETKLSDDALESGVLSDIWEIYGPISHIKLPNDKKAFTFVCDEVDLNDAKAKLKGLAVNFHSTFTDVTEITNERLGEGRLMILDQPIRINEAIDIIKKHLKLDHVLLASSHHLQKKNFNDGYQLISSIAVCAGSGSSVLKGAKANLYITGEMGHHELLDVTNNTCAPSSVILCNHSNTERGFLSDFMLGYLKGELKDKVEILVSECDVDPLVVV